MNDLWRKEVKIVVFKETPMWEPLPQNSSSWGYGTNTPFLI